MGSKNHNERRADVIKEAEDLACRFAEALGEGDHCAASVMLALSGLAAAACISLASTAEEAVRHANIFNIDVVMKVISHFEAPSGSELQ